MHRRLEVQEHVVGIVVAEQIVASFREIGAPWLSDAVWLYGGSKEAVARQIAAPRHGVMPAWAGRLDDATIKMLTLYVHSLGGGQ